MASIKNDISALADSVDKPNKPGLMSTLLSFFLFVFRLKAFHYFKIEQTIIRFN